uniref:CAP-Gly domain-containing protein n=1 Tax=Salmo trutta TaxID=8032 RepID=A0A673XF03_SALTR
LAECVLLTLLVQNFNYTISSFEGNKRYNRGITIAKFKGKLEMVVGTPASSMELQLFSTTDKFMQKLDDNEALLGSYPVHDDCKIHVCTSVSRTTLCTTLFTEQRKMALTRIEWRPRCTIDQLALLPTSLIFCLAGIVDFKPGHLVGVKCNEPLGKHDGRPLTMTVGHFPEEDFHLDEM